ncbi:MAG TPA: hypothetical protein VMM18_16200 [Gemmatimonadaceae bacterium]|nr:hypothetical protein [Gemmatimonadaceae bacterium]
MKKLISFVLATAVLSAAGPRVALAQAQQPAPRLDQVMSAEERAATGVARLTPEERTALEAWLARYTSTVMAVVRGLEAPAAPVAPAAAPAEPRIPPPPAVVAPRTFTPGPPTTAPHGAHVFRSASGGTFVMLQDGTMWEIYFGDRASTASWRAGDFVSVGRQPAPIGEFRYQLVNAAGRGKVSARFAGFIRSESDTTVTGRGWR